MPRWRDWNEVGWLARALSLPPRAFYRWIDAGHLEAFRHSGPSGRGGKPRYRIYTDSLVAHLNRWSQTHNGRKHLARIGAKELLRRKLIDESTRDRIEAARERKALAALGTDECD